MEPRMHPTELGAARGNPSAAPGNSSAAGGNSLEVHGNSSAACGNCSAAGGNRLRRWRESLQPLAGIVAPLAGTVQAAGGNSSAAGGNSSAAGGNSSAAGGNSSAAPAWLPAIVPNNSAQQNSRLVPPPGRGRGGLNLAKYKFCSGGADPPRPPGTPPGRGELRRSFGGFELSRLRCRASSLRQTVRSGQGKKVAFPQGWPEAGIHPTANQVFGRGNEAKEDSKNEWHRIKAGGQCSP